MFRWSVGRQTGADQIDSGIGPENSYSDRLTRNMKLRLG